MMESSKVEVGHKPTFIDSNTIHSLYKLSQKALQNKFNNLRIKILDEFEEFKNRLLSVLRNLNYLRYNKSHPNDDILFVFKDRKKTTSLTQHQLEHKENILQRMNNYNIVKDDVVGISENCIWEIDNYLLKANKTLNWNEICPSGATFLQSNKTSIENFIQFWRDVDDRQTNLTAVFKQVSPCFPQDQIKKLGNIFVEVNKTVISARLVFRASQHNFQSSMFKQICSGRPNTLLLAKSDKGMIFGGFTPCKWLKTKEKQFVPDPSGESFLFSLNHVMVFPIKKNQLDYAISAYGGWGPIFGSPYGPDLSISDKCHMNDNSCSSLGSHYEIPSNVKEYSNQAFSLLAGSKKFKVLEYEVYELFMAD